MPSYLDDWDKHKADHVWRKFWALWELRRKWKWADWFYKRLDRVGEDIVEPKAWSLMPGEGYMKLCLWAAFLRGVQEGITTGLDALDTPASDKVPIGDILGLIPSHLNSFPVALSKQFKDFRNAVFHCQWSPQSAKLELNSAAVNKLDSLHKELGLWLDGEFKVACETFSQKYNPPAYWLMTPDGKEWMPEMFY